MPKAFHLDKTRALFEASLELEPVFGEATYKRGIEKLNDRADPVAEFVTVSLPKNDDSPAVALADPPANLLSLIALPDGKQWATGRRRINNRGRTIR